jgi:hypothetical protein
MISPVFVHNEEKASHRIIDRTGGASAVGLSETALM